MISYLILGLALGTSYYRTLRKPIWFTASPAWAFVEVFINFLLFSYAAAEFLSLFQAYHAFGISSFLMAWVSLELIFVFRSPSRRPRQPIRWTNPYTLYVALLICLLVFLSVYVPPNNWDSFNYHLTRIEHWRQNGNVYPFASADARQISYSPLAEYAIAVMQIGTGADYLSNLLQTAALLGILIVFHASMKMFRIAGHVRGLGIIFFLSHPQIIFEASTTQNDLVTVLIYALVLYFFLTIIFREEEVHKQLSKFCMFIALGGLLKYSLWVFELPLIGLMGILLLKRGQLRKLPGLFLQSFAFLAIGLGPFWMRNGLYYGHFLGDPFLSGQLGNESKSIETLLSNGLKNVADYGFSPIPGWNTWIFKAVQGIHEAMHISLNEAGRNFESNVFQAQFYFSEDNASSLPHLLVFLLALIMFFVSGWKHKFLRGILFILLANFCLYSLIFKWQYFGIRLQLPLFYLASGFIGLQLQALLGERNRPYLAILTLLFALYGLFPVFFNKNKPMLSSGQLRTWFHKPKGLFLNTEWETLGEEERVIQRAYYVETREGHWSLRKDLGAQALQECFEVQQRAHYFDRFERSIWGHTRWENYFILMPEVQQQVEKGFSNPCVNQRPLHILADGFVAGWAYPYFVYVKTHYPAGSYLSDHVRTSEHFKQNHPSRAYYTCFPAFLMQAR